MYVPSWPITPWMGFRLEDYDYILRQGYNQITVTEDFLLIIHHCATGDQHRLKGTIARQPLSVLRFLKIRGKVQSLGLSG